jgi:DUF4097 and DUF4098 domain-containing protein YvlB
MRIAFIAAALLGTLVHADTVERRTAADPRGEVEITNVAGGVRVEGWDRAEVQLDADLGSGVERLDFERRGNLVVIEVVLPQRSSRSGSSDLVVKVPRQSSLAITTVSADQTVTNVRGAQRLQSVSGEISTQTWDSDVELKTVSGDVQVVGNDGKSSSRVSSVSGEVKLEKIGPQLDLTTVTGDMRIDMKELARAHINTTNGNLVLTSRLGDNARLDVQAVNGDLRFALLGKLDASFDVETFNGDIASCFGPEPQRSRRHGPGNEWRHTVGGGSARVRVKTLNGGVEICDK